MVIDVLDAVAIVTAPPSLSLNVVRFFDFFYCTYAS